MHQQTRISRINLIARKENAALAHTLRIAFVLSDESRHPRFATSEFSVTVLPMQQADASGDQKDAGTDQGRLRTARLCLWRDRQGELRSQPFGGPARRQWQLPAAMA